MAAPDGTADGEGLNFAGKAAILSFPILTTFCTVVLFPILPMIAKEFADTPNSEALVRMLVTSCGLALAVSAPFMGAIAAKVGWRPTLVTATILYGAAGAAGGLADNLYMLLLSRALVGVAAAALGTLLLAILTMRYEGDKRNTWLGYTIFLGTFSGLVLTPMAGVLGEQGWRVPIYFHAIGVLLALPILAGISEPKLSASAAAGKGGGVPWGLIGVGVVIGVCVGAPGLFIPFHLAGLGITAPKLIALAMVSSAASGALGSFFYDRVRRKASMRLTFIVAFLCMAVGLGVIGLTKSLEMTIVGNLISGLGVGIAVPNLFSYAATISSERDRARNIGLGRGACLAAPMLAQFALEPLSKAQGPTAAVAAIAVVALLGAAGFRMLTMDAPRPAMPEAPPA